METLADQMSARPYGTWSSEITAELVAEGSVRLGQIKTEGETVYWVEERPTESGRGVLVRVAKGGHPTGVTPPGFSVKTRAHEYGGGDFLVHDGVVFFANEEDQRVYRQDGDDNPVAITPPGPQRYADGVYDAGRDRILCVVEDHGDGANEPANSIAVLDPREETPARPLIEGSDFYSNPVLSPDGARLAWLCWNHPNMPWDGTRLMVSTLATDGSVDEPVCMAGGEDESIFQPQWGPDGTLYFVSDSTGWWNLYRWDGEQVTPVLAGEFETGLPQWVFGMSTYAILEDGRLVVAVCQRGIWHLSLVEPGSGNAERLKLPDSEIQGVALRGNGFVYCGGSPREAPAIVGVRLDVQRRYVIRRSGGPPLDADLLSYPKDMTFPAADGSKAHAFLYRPAHPTAFGPEDEHPPLIVKSHGGPTACASTALDLRTQFWTSRGFAVLDVNYRGSTGYGRAYRRALDGAWGVADVEDCVGGARHLAEDEKVDKDRLIITGRSAGGYTTLAALTFHNLFKAGASYYGISDLEALAKETHKFEARYLDRLVGRYPDAKDRYIERSPIHHADQLACPCIFLQGALDDVVPPNQAERMVDVLRAKGLPVAYLLFDEERHGFRRAESIIQSLEGEYYFYSRLFGFDPADDLEPIDIENLDVGDDFDSPFQTGIEGLDAPQ